MPSIIHSHDAPKRKRGKYVHLLRQVLDTDQSIAFTPEELPKTGIAAVRSTADKYGWLISVITVDGVHYVRVFTKEFMSPEEADAATAAAELARKGKK